MPRDPSVNPNRGSPDVLHGGEPRLTQEEIAAAFAASRAEHPGLVDENAALSALLAGSGRRVMDGSGLTFHSEGAYATIRYASGGCRWRVTLECQAVASVTASPEPLAAFGAALYRLRTARRWSLREAAQAAGVSVTTVMRAEQGRSVGLAQALGLAGAYGTTVGALLDGEVRT